MDVQNVSNISRRFVGGSERWYKKLSRRTQKKSAGFLVLWFVSLAAFSGSLVPTVLPTPFSRRPSGPHDRVDHFAADKAFDKTTAYKCRDGNQQQVCFLLTYIFSWHIHGPYIYVYSCHDLENENSSNSRSLVNWCIEIVVRDCCEVAAFS